MLVCGLIGDATIGVPLGIPDPPVVVILAAIVYGIAANICYTGGYLGDSSRKPYDPTFGPRAFRRGVILSVGLTMLPAALCWTLLVYSLFNP